MLQGEPSGLIDDAAEHHGEVEVGEVEVGQLDVDVHVEPPVAPTLRGDSFCSPSSLRARARGYSLRMTSPTLTTPLDTQQPPRPRCGAATKTGRPCGAKAALAADGSPGPCPLHRPGGPSPAVLAARAKGLAVMLAEQERLADLAELRATEAAARAVRDEAARRALFDPQSFVGRFQRW